MTAIPPITRAIVVRRDEYRCQAPRIDGRCGWCRDIWGNVITHWPNRDPGPQYLQMSHTKDRDKLALSKKAPHDPAHLISLCPWHHTGTQGGSNWEAVHREEIRKFLEELYSPVRSYR